MGVPIPERVLCVKGHLAEGIKGSGVFVFGEVGDKW
jgi:hypothetical protein